MKKIVILENVALPSMPAFKKGQEVRVADGIADLLVERKHARYSTGKSRAEMQAERSQREGYEEEPDVKVEKSDKKGKRSKVSEKRTTQE